MAPMQVLPGGLHCVLRSNHLNSENLAVQKMKLLYSLAVASLSTLLIVPVLLAQELPKVPKAEVFALTPEPGYFTEPGVAVNPSDPKQVVAVFQDNAHAAYSWDSGHSWTVAEGVAPSNY